MTRKEAIRQTEQANTLQALGFTYEEAEQLRRISMTLQRWHELECGTGDGQVTRSIERDGDEPDSTPYLRVQYPSQHGYQDHKYPVPDRETGARTRLAKIIAARNARQTPICANYYGVADGYQVSAYIQGDPRGAALYILRPGDVPEGGDPSAYYSRGVCIY